MNTSAFKGSATAIITPMNMDGSISYKKMEELLEYQISHHTNAIVVAGTTGESACLSDEEHLRLIQFTCRIVNGRIPVITGAGSNNTSHNFYVKTRKMQVQTLYFLSHLIITNVLRTA